MPEDDSPKAARFARLLPFFEAAIVLPTLAGLALAITGAEWPDVKDTLDQLVLWVVIIALVESFGTKWVSFGPCSIDVRSLSRLEARASSSTPWHPSIHRAARNSFLPLGLPLLLIMLSTRLLFASQPVFTSG